MYARDIRGDKNNRREQIKSMRRALAPQEKEALDDRVMRGVLRLYQYKRAKTVLLYMSTAIEVDTQGIMADALQNGKRVALPRCIPGTREMRFYLVQSVADLEKGSFSLLEPKTTCTPFVDDGHSICIVPALCYDRSGYRLGYGGGYYDRFLSTYGGPRIGVIYSANLCRALPHGRFDRPVQLVVSDKGFFYTQKARESVGRRSKTQGPARKSQPPVKNAFSTRTGRRESQ